MAYTVHPVNGDSLCSLAKRHGFSNCGTVRTANAGAAFLDRPLLVGDVVTIPQARDGYFYTKVATARRLTFVVRAAFVLPNPRLVRFVRTANALPSDHDAIAQIGISRYATRFADAAALVAFPDATVRVHDATAAADPEAFNLEVIDDQNGMPAEVEVYLEALRPTYTAGAFNNAHVRFPTAIRAQRSLAVKLSRMGGAHTHRHRSCYLRLVVDEPDKGSLPAQSLLVTDMMSGQGPLFDPEVEPLDQRVSARYEDSSCSRPRGDRCLLAQAFLDIPHGDAIDVHARIVRTHRVGAVGQGLAGPDTDAPITRADVHQRILGSTRRIWAQQGISFVLACLDTVDPPSDMLTVAEPDGATADGRVAGAARQSTFGFQLNVTTGAVGHEVVTQHVLAPRNITAGNTPLVTAQDFAGAITALLQGPYNAVQVTASLNPAVDTHGAGSADVVMQLPGGRIEIVLPTADTEQDRAQRIEIVAYDNAQFLYRAGPTNAHAGHPMQRALYKSFATVPRSLNVFVVDSFQSVGTNGHTINSAVSLPAQFRPIAAMENCIAVRSRVMGIYVNQELATLAHEIGHALTDNAEHSDAMDDDSIGSLMLQATSDFHGHGTDTKRIKAIPAELRTIVDTIGYAGAHLWPNPGNSRIWVANETHSLSARVTNNARIIRTPRP